MGGSGFGQKLKKHVQVCSRSHCEIAMLDRCLGACLCLKLEIESQSDSSGYRSLVESTSVQGRGHKVLAYVNMFISVVVIWQLTRQHEGWLPTGNVFRNYYPTDQWSHAGFAANGRAGDLSLGEPFTGTGVSFHPSWWYQFKGSVGNALGLDFESTWNTLGTAVVLLNILWIGFVAWKITGLCWSPLALPASLLILLARQGGS